MEVVGGVSLRPPSAQAPARIGQLSSVDVAGRLVLRAAPRRQPATARRALVVEARGGRSWSERQMLQQRRAPQLPKVEDDGNPRFVIFIRTANVRDRLHPSICFFLGVVVIWFLAANSMARDRGFVPPAAGLLLVPAQRHHRRHDGEDHARRQGQLPRQVHLQGHARQEPRCRHLQSNQRDQQLFAKSLITISYLHRPCTTVQGNHTTVLVNSN